MKSDPGVAPRAPRAAPKRRATNYLIDPRFQLKYTGLLVAVVVSVMLALGIVIWNTAEVASDHAESAAQHAETALKESLTSAKILRMNELMEAGDNPELVATVEAGLKESEREAQQNLALVQRQRGELGEQRRRMSYLLLGGGGLIVLLLAAMGIFITHKVVGPVFKLKRLLRQVGTSRLVVSERLRKGDELGDLFATFLQMTYSMRALSAGRQATLDATIRKIEVGGAPDEVRADLQALRAQLGHGVDAEPRSLPEGRGTGAPYPMLSDAVEALCERLDACGYHPTPLVDLGVLVANADGTIDASEIETLRHVLQPLLGEGVSDELVSYLVDASLDVLRVAGVEARTRLVADILIDCDAVEEGLVIALAMAFASEGLSNDEQEVVAAIAREAGFPESELAALIPRVRAAAEARRSVPPPAALSA